MKVLTVPIAPKRLRLFLLVSAAVAGCASPGYVVENPVNNPVPALKPGVYSVTAVDVRPAATREIEPDFPPDLEAILTGKAVVVFTVRADGKVTDTSVVEADDVLFGEAAVRAVRKWRFHPAQLHGAPVDCRMTLPFVFTSPYGFNQGGGEVPGSPLEPPPSDSPQTSVESR